MTSPRKSPWKIGVKIHEIRAIGSEPGCAGQRFWTGVGGAPVGVGVGQGGCEAVAVGLASVPGLADAAGEATSATGGEAVGPGGLALDVAPVHPSTRNATTSAAPAGANMLRNDARDRSGRALGQLIYRTGS